MKLFFDENLGTALPESVQALGVCRATCVVHIWRDLIKSEGRSVDDLTWMRFAAKNSYMAISADTAILDSESERQTLIEAGLGVVFLTSGTEYAADVMAWILRRREWLETLYDSEPRPFAWRTSLRGRARRDPRV